MLAGSLSRSERLTRDSVLEFSSLQDPVQEGRAQALDQGRGLSQGEHPFPLPAFDQGGNGLGHPRGGGVVGRPVDGPGRPVAEHHGLGGVAGGEPGRDDADVHAVRLELQPERLGQAPQGGLARAVNIPAGMARMPLTLERKTTCPAAFFRASSAARVM